MDNGVLRRDDGSHLPLYGWPQPFIHTALIGLVVAGAYYLSARAGLALTFKPGNFIAFWPPATILLVALLMTLSSRGWAVLLASLPPHVIAMMQVGRLGFFSAVFGLLTWLGAWIAVVTCDAPGVSRGGWPGSRTFIYIRCVQSSVGPCLWPLPAQRFRR